MLNDAFELIASISHWSFWDHFSIGLVAPSPLTAGSIFGFAEYLASLALLLVVFTASDFRYRYRFATAPGNLKTIGAIISFLVGFLILLVDIIYQNAPLVPRHLQNPNNIKAALGFVFLLFVFHIIRIMIVSPPIFGRRNAERFYVANYHFIHEGNPDRLQIIAEELRGSLTAIVKFASKVGNRSEKEKPKIQTEVDCANDFMLLFGDKRFCKIVVERVPTFSLILFQEVKNYNSAYIPVHQFSRNIGREFIINTSSAYYQESAGYETGLFGYTRPITKIIFGSYEFIEKCAKDGASPLDIEPSDLAAFDRVHMKGLKRAALAFFEDYLVHTKGRSYPHSYALSRLMHSFEYALIGVHQLHGKESFYNDPEFQRLSVTVDFIKEAITLIQAHAEIPNTWRCRESHRKDVFDNISNLIFETVFSAASVSSPVWTAWHVQHNSVWADIFGCDNSRAMKVVMLKVRRLLYAEIRRMDDFPNFKSARILGFCLFVLGLKLVDRNKGYKKEFYPLQAAALKWATENYKRLVDNNPKVAAACLMGSITYDPDAHRLVQTYSRNTQKEPHHEYLLLK